MTKHVTEFSEKEIQEYLWIHKDDITRFIDFDQRMNPIEIDLTKQDYNPEDLIWNLVSKRINKYIDNLRALRIVGSALALSKEGDSTITMDMMGTYEGWPGVAVIELKKSSGTEREALTELLGYGNHVAAVFPGSTKADIALLLVAPMHTRITREAYLQSLLFDNRRILALRLSFEDPLDLSTLRLIPWLPTKDDIKIISRASFDPRNLDVSKVVWQAHPGWWNETGTKDPRDSIRRKFDQAAAIAAQRMEREGIHGFVYCSQTWPEVDMPYPNSIVVVGINPIAVGSVLSFLEQGATPEQIPSPRQYCADFETLFPGLSNIEDLTTSPVEDELGWPSDLYSITDGLYANWNANIFRVAQDTADLVTATTKGDGPRTDRGHMTWHEYTCRTTEDDGCFNFAVFPTGILRDLYHAVHMNDISLFANKEVPDHPYHGDYPYCSIDGLSSHVLFRSFLDRMLNGVAVEGGDEAELSD